MSFYSISHRGDDIDVLNCLGKIGLREATTIWPTKKLDILVLLSSGIPDKESAFLAMNTKTKEPQQSGIMRAKDWEVLEPPFPKSATALFRFDPVISQHFQIDDDAGIARISSDTIDWLERRHDYIVAAANQLIAALFYYNSLSQPQATHQFGEISCRLPWDLKERACMVEHLTSVAVRHNGRLFAVTSAGCRAMIDLIPALKRLRRGENFVIRVDIEKVSSTTTKQMKVDISMIDIFGGSNNWYPISGSPYSVRCSWLYFILFCH